MLGQDNEKIMSRQNSFCCDIIVYVTIALAKEGNSYCDEMLLCHDRVFQHGENLCRDRVFLRCDRKSQDIRFPCRDITLYVTTVG